ncbi:MAG: hypothetical protein RIS80_671 [Actinomycetota bacterium]
MLARVTFDESHRPAWSTRPEVAEQINPANPSDAGYVKAATALVTDGFDVEVHQTGSITNALSASKVFVSLHASNDEFEATTGVGNPSYQPEEIDALVAWVEAGGGLVLFAETEQLKYGNSAAAIAERFGIKVLNVTAQDAHSNYKDVATWVLGDLMPSTRHNLVAGVGQACFYRAGALEVSESVADRTFVVAATSGSASPANAPLLVVQTHGRGRVVICADSDIFGDDSIDDLDHLTLWRNLVTWVAATADGSGDGQAAVWTATDANWLSLVEAVEGMRELQLKDGSIDPELGDEAKGSALKLSNQMIDAIRNLSPRFEHQSEQLEATIRDIEKWQANGFGVPDFLDSLLLFRPDLHRRDGLENLAVFPMYTQNGNPNRNFEAVVTRTAWPNWIAELEAKQYNNPAFVPIEFVAFTKGYDTNSAVLFPETVATRELAKFYWGGIFCDREAARFRRITAAASELLKLALPADAEYLLADQHVTQETYMLWDLVHDRAHSHGDLPFDPFMIKQRMPFWMYALEELRCDLTTFRETQKLEEQGVYLARFVRLAILFDRLFRFPITGDRVRNYDGLGGQIIFAWLHKNGVLHWTDNQLSLDWEHLNSSMVELCEQVEDLYRTGIDRSRLAHWLSSYEFVSGLVEPHPGSAWAKGVDHLPVTGELREMVDLVMPDEFPLNVFYEALRKKLAPEIAATAGITA